MHTRYHCANLIRIQANLFIPETKIKIIPCFKTNDLPTARVRYSHEVIITNYELRITNYTLATGSLAADQNG